MWFLYIEDLESSNSSSFKVMATVSASVGKENRCASPVRNLVFNGIESSYVVPAVLSYVSPNGEKNKGEHWDCDVKLHTAIIPGTYVTVMCYPLWYKEMNRDCSCQECKRWYRY